MASTLSMLAGILILQIAIFSIAKGQQSLDPTPNPTHTLFPCDYIDPVLNASNCGACVANDSCIWCTADQSCHEKSGYDEAHCVDPKSGDSRQTISGAGHLYQCCESSASCAQCTTLEYVLCDWCIPTQRCFNASEPAECSNGEDGEYGKHIVFKDGVCRGQSHQSIWDKIKEYYLSIPILFRCILDTLLSLCLVLLIVCCCLAAKNKVHQKRLQRKYKKMKINNSSRDYLRFKEHQ